MKLRAVLVDDEPLALARLERMLERHADRLEIVATAADGSQAVEVINQLRPDVVFLDVQMPELDGFDVLERLDFEPLIVFSTAYDQYALKAFDVHSVDYLLKPVDRGRLELAIDRLWRLSRADAGDLHQRVREAVETLKSRPVQRIQVKTGDRIKLVPVSEIAFFLASEKYVEVHTRNRSFLITRTLASLESELPAAEFVRVHRSAIVNVDFIDEISRSFGGAYVVRMKDAEATLLPISRRYKSRLELG